MGDSWIEELIQGHHKGKIRQPKTGDLVSSVHEEHTTCGPCLDPDLNNNCKRHFGDKWGKVNTGLVLGNSKELLLLILLGV